MAELGKILYITRENYRKKILLKLIKMSRDCKLIGIIVNIFKNHKINRVIHFLITGYFLLNEVPLFIKHFLLTLLIETFC
jgi:hypothetical protein